MQWPENKPVRIWVDDPEICGDQLRSIFCIESDSDCTVMADAAQGIRLYEESFTEHHSLKGEQRIHRPKACMQSHPPFTSQECLSDFLWMQHGLADG